MSLFSKKKKTTIELSDSTVRIIRMNLDNIGVTIPLSAKELKKVFDWMVAQHERCTGKECSIKLDGGTDAELELAVRELNPYGEQEISLTHLNRKLKGTE